MAPIAPQPTDTLSSETRAKVPASHPLSETCMDCHKGIAHRKPEGMTEEDE